MQRPAAKLKVGIIGTGRVSADLLLKTLHSEVLECCLFVGRNANCEGIQRAKSLGVSTSDRSIQAVVDAAGELGIVFDATSANHHRVHAPILERLGILAVDLTPARVGYSCVPCINLRSVRYAKNINLITCAAQAAIPVAHALSASIPGLERLSVCSIVAADSIGSATLENLDDYYSNTEAAIKRYSGIPRVSFQLQIAEPGEQPDMLTALRGYATAIDMPSVMAALEGRVEQVRRYVPGYQLATGPRRGEGYVQLAVRVRALEDYLPAHAGNLHITNCAAMAVAEDYAVRQLTIPEFAAHVGLRPGLTPWLRFARPLPQAECG
ncbi:acetylating acetaldehyde dehydrogenase [Myxococcota bacterium]